MQGEGIHLDWAPALPDTGPGASCTLFHFISITTLRGGIIPPKVQSSKGHITLGCISCKQQKQCLLMEAKRKFNERNGIVYRIEGKGGEPGFREDGEQR